MIGFMANNVLPFRLGEFVRPWALARREHLSKSTLLATVVVERAIDMLTLLGIFAVSMMVHPIAENTDAGRLLQWGARVLIGLCVVLTAFVVAAERNRALPRAWCARDGGPAGRGARARRAHARALPRRAGAVRDLRRLTLGSRCRSRCS